MTAAEFNALLVKYGDAGPGVAYLATIFTAEDGFRFVLRYPATHLGAVEGRDDALDRASEFGYHRVDGGEWELLGPLESSSSEVLGVWCPVSKAKRRNFYRQDLTVR